MTSPSPDLGPYALKAALHWERFLPQEYAKIPPAGRATFFTRIGDEIERRIELRTGELRPDGTGETAEPPSYLGSLARQLGARTEAEQQVLDEMLPAPEDPEDPEDLESSPGS